MRKHRMAKALIIAVLILATVLGLVACADDVFTATFVTNGGTEVAAMEEVTAVESAPATTRDGYTFAGWYTDEALTTAAEFPFTLEADTTFYAKWTKNEYTATFVTNGGSAVANVTGSVIEAAPASTREFYALEGWYLDEGLTQKAQFPYEMSGNTTFYAKWTLAENAAVVTFDYAGGSGEETSRIVTKGGKVGELPVPTRAGFEFVGWFDGENAVTADTAINANVTLTAKWLGKEVTITFDYNIAALEEMLGLDTIVESPVRPPVKSVTVRAGEMIEKPAALEALYVNGVGYLFKSEPVVTWTVDGEAFDISAPVDRTEDFTLTAEYATATVTFDPAEGAFVDTQFGGTISVPKGLNSQVLLSITPEVVRENYTFSKWGIPNGVSAVGLTEDVTYTAEYDEDLPRVTFNPNEGTFTDESFANNPSKYAHPRMNETIEQILDGRDLETLATRPGYVLVGWFDEEDVEWTMESEYTDYVDRTLTARWEAVEYTLTLDFDGGSSDPAVESLKVDFNSEISGLPVPVKDGFEFGGWFYNGGEQPLQVKDGDVYTWTESITVTARWLATAVDVTLNADGGTVDGESTVSIQPGGEIGALPAASKDGFTFMFWTYNGEKVEEGDVFTPEGENYTFVAAYTEYFTPGLTFSFGSDGYRVTGTAVTDENVIIPSTYNDAMTGGSYGEQPVTEVWSFMNNKNIKTVQLPDTITSLGANAFSGCSNLTGIEIPEKVTVIPGNAFLNCAGITEIDLTGITEIGDTAFRGTGLTSVNIPATVTTIGTGAFMSCKSLTEITFEEGVNITEIPDSFASESTLAAIVLPDSVQTIGMRAFNVTNLTAIAFSANVTEIGTYAFQNCVELADITFAEGEAVLAIGKQAFENTAWTELTLTSAVKEIGYRAFYGNKIQGKTVTVTRTDGIISEGDVIGYPTNDSILGAAAAIAAVYVPEELLAAYEENDYWTIYPLEAAASTPEIPEGVTIVDNVLTAIDSTVVDLVIPEGVTEIGMLAGIGGDMSNINPNTTLKSVVIPASVTKINTGAFMICTALESITFAPGSNLNEIAEQAINGTAITEITIPASVKIIGNGALAGNEALAKITFEEGFNPTSVGWGQLDAHKIKCDIIIEGDVWAEGVVRGNTFGDPSYAYAPWEEVGTRIYVRADLVEAWKEILPNYTDYIVAIN